MRLLLSLLIFLGACKDTMPPQEADKIPYRNLKIFPSVNEHTHGSTIVELPNGDLLAAWFQGSGERWADDVAIMGARLLKGQTNWSKPFVMADVPGFPDINPALFLDGKGHLWLTWYTVLANLWETSLPKYRISENYMMSEGPPEWKWQEVLHVKPGGSTERGIQPNDPFLASVKAQMDSYAEFIKDSLDASIAWKEGWQAWRQQKYDWGAGANLQFNGYLYDDKGDYTKQKMGYPLFRRIGWQTKNKAILLDGKRIILPLYSDGLGYSLMAITDDEGSSWKFSQPLVGFENIQASLARKKDGTLLAYMRDNGPPPQRLQMSSSKDLGMTWSPVRDSEIPNPGSGADLAVLGNGHWVLAYNDTEDGRYSLAVSLSEDEGGSWPFTQHLEYESPEANTTLRASYPSIIVGENQQIHVVYSYSKKDEQGENQECIKYASFDETWIRTGEE